MGYRLTRKAETDLAKIYQSGLADFGTDQADAYLDSLVYTFDLLAASPGIARLRLELRPPVRIHTHRAHIIIYREVGAEILIIRIRHSREDWSRDPR